MAKQLKFDEEARRALEAGVARDEHPLPAQLPRDVHHHTFQRAAPDFHISLTCR